MRHPLTRPLAAVLALLTWAALALQFYLSATTHLPNLLVNFFSFFTILTNLLVAAVCTGLALRTRPHPTPGLQAATAVYITVVGLGYTLLLRHIWNPQGLQKLADTLLHDAVPILYVLLWLTLLRPRARLPWRAAATWLLWPAIYLIYSLVRGALTGWYPYPFLDPRTLGYPRVALVVAICFAVAFALSLATIALTRHTPGTPRHPPSAHPSEADKAVLL